MRDYTIGFSAVHRYEGVAVLDGGTIEPCIRPAAAGDAIGEARRELGSVRYDQLRDGAALMSPTELDEFLLTQVGDLR